MGFRNSWTDFCYIQRSWKQETFLKQRTADLDKLVEIVKIQSTESFNTIEGLITTKKATHYV